MFIFMICVFSFVVVAFQSISFIHSLVVDFVALVVFVIVDGALLLFSFHDTHIFFRAVVSSFFLFLFLI